MDGMTINHIVSIDHGSHGGWGCEPLGMLPNAVMVCQVLPSQDLFHSMYPIQNTQNAIMHSMLAKLATQQEACCNVTGLLALLPFRGDSVSFDMVAT